MAFSLAGLVFCSGLCFSSAFLSSRRYRNPVPLFPSVDEHWFDQKLDHFNGAESRVWKQRFFINDTFYDGGPVFLMIGGEGPANPAWMVSGTWLRYAEKLKALCLLLEHRFYGKSHPTEDMRTANLQYLSSKQALADLAHFQTVMTQKLKLSHSKWVAFGGSYPGSLATWYRLKYPHLIYAAVATSAPVYALINFTEYLEVVQTSLADYNSECPKAVKSASDTLVMMLKKKENYVKITEDFKLCEILQINSEMDSAYFLETLAGNFMDVVQYNNDNRAFEGVKGTNITIQVLCEIMADVSLGTPYDRYAAVAHLMMDALEMKCMDTSYKKYVQEMTSATWEGPAAVGGRQWVYQTCTEFGFFQSTDSTNQPFSGFSLSYFVQQCTDIYGPEFNFTRIVNAVGQTNEMYGGFNIQSSRIVFSNGCVDPWHALGIIKDLSEELPAVYIKGTAHCANMYPARADDPPQLAAARLYILSLLEKWIN
ncbi:putative serine protease K12H4.7 isoform X1 [Rhinatrema bivittatum]|uniref:putative serine protease K12H4.7 isoform X1 n=1 Tax=Rhinatrema bivittatum TaxID=194408 RepID=UPI00112C620C|nr:putative serine protease K12H4.7 isoform X1 [Rhinatrema bivittatum]